VAGTRAAWTPERRARQSEIIRCTRPWRKSTGPRTSEGKAKSSKNATYLRDDPVRRAAYLATQLFLKNPSSPMAPLLTADIRTALTPAELEQTRAEVAWLFSDDVPDGEDDWELADDLFDGDDGDDDECRDDR
jgi:hypothetical protein